jgi:hypothetical protein
MGNYMRQTFFLEQSEVKSGLGVRELRDRPSLLLSLIMDKVMFAEVIHHPTFPSEWEIITQLQQPGYTPKTDGKAPRNGDKPTHPGVRDRTRTNPGPQPVGTKWIHPCELRHSKNHSSNRPSLSQSGKSPPHSGYFEGRQCLDQRPTQVTKASGQQRTVDDLLDECTPRMHKQGLFVQTTGRACCMR